MLDDNSALFWGFVFMESISFIFIKFWGKKIIPTFISGFLFSFVILNYISFFDEKTALNVILPLIGTSSLVLLICLSLKENDSLQILKRKSIYLASAACLVMGTISFLINKSIGNEEVLNEPQSIFLTITILSLLYELFVHKIIWQMIMKKENLTLKILLCSLVTIILICLTWVEWGKSVLVLIVASVTLIISGVFRFFCMNDSYFWVCIILRGIFYFIMFTVV